MKARNMLLFLGLACSWAAAQAGTGQSDFSLRNAEDLVASSDGLSVFASSMAGGGQPSGQLAVIDVRAGTVRPLIPATGAAPSSGSKTCTQPVAAKDFNPHGLALHRSTSGQEQLFVVNHGGGRESIEIYHVTGGNRPALRWTGCIALPAGLFGNSVTVSAGGTIYMTNMGKSLNGKYAGGDVVFWRPESGWQTVPDSRIAGANGILSAPDGKSLYVASWLGRELVELTLDNQTSTRRALPLAFLPDNLRWGAGGNILVAGQSSDPKAVEECFYSSAPQCSIPSAMAEIDAATLTLRCTRPIPITAATVALNVNDVVFVGTLRGERVNQLDAGCGTAG